MTSTFGPGMAPRAIVTIWDAPRMFAAQGEGWGDMPPIATEWSVEARAGGVCLVRVVHSLFASTDDWDNQLESAGLGWPGFFRTLRIYLTHLRGQRSEIMQFVAPVAGSEAEGWETLTAGLGLSVVRDGQHWTAPAEIPAASGAAGYVSQSPYDILLRLDRPVRASPSSAPCRDPPSQEPRRGSVRKPRTGLRRRRAPLGTGTRFFEEGTPTRAFEHVSTNTTPSGTVFSAYKVAGPLKAG